MDEILDQHARAVQGSARMAAKVREEDLSRPTPCAGWTVADLLVHMTAQHNGFAAAAAGDGADLDRWRPGQPGREWLVTDSILAAGKVIGAFAAAGVLEREFSLPEISTRMRFPARQAIGFHLVDYVAHGWDVARSLGLDYDLDQDVLDTALAIAQAVPDDDRTRRQPGAPFAPRIEPAGAGTFDRILTLLGRDPAWA